MPLTSQTVRLSVSPSLKSTRPEVSVRHAHLLGERGQVLALHPVERRERLQQLDGGFALFGHVFPNACFVFPV